VHRWSLSRQADHYGHSCTVIRNPEKRKVGGSTPPLTTSDLRQCLHSWRSWQQRRGAPAADCQLPDRITRTPPDRLKSRPPRKPRLTTADPAESPCPLRC